MLVSLGSALSINGPVIVSPARPTTSCRCAVSVPTAPAGTLRGPVIVSPSTFIYLSSAYPLEIANVSILYPRVVSNSGVGSPRFAIAYVLASTFPPKVGDESLKILPPLPVIVNLVGSVKSIVIPSPATSFFDNISFSSWLTMKMLSFISVSGVSVSCVNAIPSPLPAKVYNSLKFSLLFRKAALIESPLASLPSTPILITCLVILTPSYTAILVPQPQLDLAFGFSTTRLLLTKSLL